MVTTDTNAVHLGADRLSIRDVVAVARESRPVTLTREVEATIERGHGVVARAVASGKAVYGVTTGFGGLANVTIPEADRAQLQINLLRSHAAGVGQPLPDDVVRAAMLLRAHSLARGYSGVRVILVKRMMELLNRNILPIVPCQGSVGASGDLAPLAHLALPLVGEGKVRYHGQVRDAADALRSARLTPIELEAKEALALTNGAQVICALGALAIRDSFLALRAAEIAAAMSYEALEGHASALSPAIHRLRPHPGQISAASRMHILLERNGHLPERGRGTVQDPYSLRCIPQVFGPVRSAVVHARQTVQVEVNSVTDNPLCFPENDAVISGGNFHGHPLALPLDYLKAAIASLGTLTERRIALLVDSHMSGLPAFLVPTAGTNSGFMIAQYSAASLASENKILAHPASVDSIPTSANMEDYNSMGTIAARTLTSVIENTRAIIAIELICAAQALDLRGGQIWGEGVSAAFRKVRETIPFIEHDECIMSDLIAEAIRLIASGELQETVDPVVSRYIPVDEHADSEEHENHVDLEGDAS